MDTLKLRNGSLFAFALTLALSACGDDPKPSNMPSGDGDTGDGDTGDGDTGDGDTGDGDTGDGDGGDAGVPGEVPESVDLPYAVDAFHVPSGFMGQGETSPEAITALPSELNDDSTCGGKRAHGDAVGACHTFTYEPNAADMTNQWAGVFWMLAANQGDWDLPGIKIASGAKEVSFYAKADTTIPLKFVAGMGEDKLDAFKIETDAQSVGKEWKKFSIPLDGVTYSSVNGAFAWVVDNASLTGEGPFTFYIDDIQWK